MSAEQGDRYDVCLSFAGAQRGYVEEVAAELNRLGVCVFYDMYEQANLWGKELSEHLDYIYRRAARFCVIFLSREYSSSMWTNHERRCALARAASEPQEYILPARFDDTEIPGIAPTVGYIELSCTTPIELASMITQKLDQGVQTTRPRPVSSPIGTSARRYTLEALAYNQDTIQAFWWLFSDVRRAARQAPARIILPTVAAQTCMLESLAAQSRPALRPRLLEVGSRFAEYTGWMAQEAGNDDEMVHWTELAKQMGAAAGSNDYEANSSLRMADLYLYRDDAQLTVEYAQNAQVCAAAGLRLRGLAAQREAQGHALAGAADLCRRALDRAQACFAAMDDRPNLDLGLGSSVLSDPGRLVLGSCLVDLGRPDHAIEVLSPEIAALPADASRTRARFGARLALAHADNGDPEAASQLGYRLIEDFRAVDSATVRVSLQRLLHSLKRFRQTDSQAFVTDLVKLLRMAPPR